MKGKTWVPYSGKLSREKTSRIGEKYDFRGENFHGLLAFAVPKDATLPNFTEKTVTNSHKTAKIRKSFFSLKSFPPPNRGTEANRNMWLPKWETLCFVPCSLQVSAVQVSPGEVLVECHSTGVVHSIKSDIHVKGIYVTKVK